MYYHQPGDFSFIDDDFTRETLEKDYFDLHGIFSDSGDSELSDYSKRVFQKIEEDGWDNYVKSQIDSQFYTIDFSEDEVGLLKELLDLL